MSYIGLSNPNTTRTTNTYTATSGQTTFAATYDVGFLDVFQNGIKLITGTDYTATNGSSVVFVTGAALNDNVEIVAYKTFSVPNVYTQAQSDSRFVASAGNQHKNYVINGKFDIWQRATTQTTSGYGSDDRWNNSNTGSTKTTSRQAFTLGQTDVPENPTYFSRTVVTSVAATGNFTAKFQRMENVLLSSGKTFTLSFYAKADATKNIAVEFTQSFGTGGAPSADVTSISVTTLSLTTNWQKYTVTGVFPSVTGKTLGTGGNDYFQFIFWLEAGATFNARTNTLGQQSGTFDLANVQLEEGSVATNFEFRNPQTELALCQRFYEKSFSQATAPVQNAGVSGVHYFPQVVAASTSSAHPAVRFLVVKRGTPSVTLFNPQAANAQLRNIGRTTDFSATTINTTLNPISELSFSVAATSPAGSAAGDSCGFHWTADAEL
jgi:hypothetical protein